MNAITWLMVNRKIAVPEFTRPEGYSPTQARLCEKIIEHLRTTPEATEEDLIAATGRARPQVRLAINELLDVRLEREKKIKPTGKYWYRLKRASL